MSLSSIMSGPSDPPPSTTLPAQSRKSSVASATDPPKLKQETMVSPAQPEPLPETIKTVPQLHNDKAMVNGNSHALLPGAVSKSIEIPQPDDDEVNAEIAKIDNMQLSEVEGPAWESAKDDYKQRSLKRALVLRDEEDRKRKVSHPRLIVSLTR
jgi:chromatin-remodeling ATPase INO80